MKPSKGQKIEFCHVEYFLNQVIIGGNTLIKKQ